MTTSEQIKTKAIDPMEITGVTFRYSILFILFFITFLNIFKPNIQFIMFIMLLILVVFFATFIVRDITTTKSIFMETLPFKNFYTINKQLTTLFLFGISVSIIFKIISLTLFIVTFNYGRRQLTNSNNISNSSLTSDNSISFNNYIRSFISSSILLVLLIAFVFILYSSYDVRVCILNIGSVLLTLSILGLSSYEMYYASRFFDVFKTKGIVYQTS